MDRIEWRLQRRADVIREAIEVVRGTNKVLKLLNEAGVPELLAKIAKKTGEGKAGVFVDRKLLEWVDGQVDAGKYRDRSHAVEEMIREEMRG